MVGMVVPPGRAVPSASPSFPPLAQRGHLTRDPASGAEVSVETPAQHEWNILANVLRQATHCVRGFCDTLSAASMNVPKPRHERAHTEQEEDRRTVQEPKSSLAEPDEELDQREKRVMNRHKTRAEKKITKTERARTAQELKSALAGKF